MVAAGIPDLLFEHFPGRLEWHARGTRAASSRCCCAAGSTSRRPTSCCAERGHDDLRFLDNGAIGRPMEGIDGPAHAYHLVPGGASKAKGVAFHLRARGYAPEECIAIGDSIEDLETADGRGALLLRRQRPESATRRCARRSPRFANVTVTEGAMGDGFYEAVVSTLAMR